MDQRLFNLDKDLYTLDTGRLRSQVLSMNMAVIQASDKVLFMSQRGKTRARYAPLTSKSIMKDTLTSLRETP